MRALACTVALCLSGCAFVLDFDEFRGSSGPDAGLDATLTDANEDTGPEDAGDVDACPPGGCSDRVVQVTLGQAHTCARMASGAVYCWGLNASGQLGTGDTTMASQPRAVAMLGAAATSISAGFGHTCATLSAGTLCWGDNVAGQLAADSTATSIPTPTRTVGGANAIGVSAGAVHTCVVGSGGAVRCAGEWMDGRLGISRTADLPRFATDVTGISSADAVAAGGEHTCALLSSGRLWCWGDDTDGQLGDGATNSSGWMAVQAMVTNVSVAETGRAHTCAIDGGSLYCWGRNGEGQLGQDAVGPASASPIPIMTLPEPVTAVAAGDTHTCAIDAVGKVWCWGTNVRGQVGLPPGTPALVPTPVPDLDGRFTAVSAGGAHTCAIDGDGALWCWGDNSNGQLGRTSATSSPERVAFP